MRAVARGACVIIFVFVLLMPASAGAQSPAYDFSVSPSPPNQGEEATFTPLLNAKTLY